MIDLITPFRRIAYRDVDHAYSCDGVPLTSATQLVSSLKKPFDRERISRRVADRDGVTQDEVLLAWEDKSKAALDRGSCVHAYIEDFFDGKASAVVEHAGELPEIAGFRRMWARLRATFDAAMVAKEIVVGDVELGVAGRIDAVMALTVDGVRLPAIWDWKTGAKFDVRNRYDTMLPPFEDVEASHLALYSVQVSVYRLILERAGIVTGEPHLMHLRSDGAYHLFRARDYRERLLEWLLESASERASIAAGGLRRQAASNATVAVDVLW